MLQQNSEGINKATKDVNRNFKRAPSNAKLVKKKTTSKMANMRSLKKRCMQRMQRN